MSNAIGRLVAGAALLALSAGFTPADAQPGFMHRSGVYYGADEAVHRVQNYHYNYRRRHRRTYVSPDYRGGYRATYFYGRCGAWARAARDAYNRGQIYRAQQAQNLYRQCVHGF
jgi:hypothetical protein